MAFGVLSLGVVFVHWQVSQKDYLICAIPRESVARTKIIIIAI